MITELLCTIGLILILKLIYDLRSTLKCNIELKETIYKQRDEYMELYRTISSDIDEMQLILNKTVSLKDISPVKSLEEIDGILHKLEGYISRASIL